MNRKLIYVPLLIVLLMVAGQIAHFDTPWRVTKGKEYVRNIPLEDRFRSTTNDMNWFDESGQLVLQTFYLTVAPDEIQKVLWIDVTSGDYQYTPENDLDVEGSIRLDIGYSPHNTYIKQDRSYADPEMTGWNYRIFERGIYLPILTYNPGFWSTPGWEVAMRYFGFSFFELRHDAQPGAAVRMSRFILNGDSGYGHLMWLPDREHVLLIEHSMFDAQLFILDTSSIPVSDQ